MVALIFGIIALVCDIISWCYTPASWLSFLGLACGIVAWAVGGSMAKKNPADGKSKAGKIMGMIVTIISIISVIITIIVLVTISAALGAALS